jgi:preprotein translocase subunit SecG
MEGLQFFLLILQIILAVLLVILVLMQKSDGDSLSGIGSGSGGLNSVVSSKASASIISKATMIIIGIFMLNCLILASLSNVKSKSIQRDLEKITREQNSIPANENNSDDQKNQDQNIDESKSSKNENIDESKNNESNNLKKTKKNNTTPRKVPIVPSVE